MAEHRKGIGGFTVTKITLSIVFYVLPAVMAAHSGGGAVSAARPAAPARVGNSVARSSYSNTATGRSVGSIGASRSAGGFGFRFGGGNTNAAAPRATIPAQRFTYTPLSAPRLSSSSPKATAAPVASAAASHVTVVKNITTTNINYRNGGWGWSGWYGPWWIGTYPFYYYPEQLYWDPLLNISFGFRLHHRGTKECPTGIQFDLKPAGKYKEWAKGGVVQEVDPETNQISIIGDVGKGAKDPIPLAPGFHAIQVTFPDGRVLKLPVSVSEGITPVPIAFDRSEDAVVAPQIQQAPVQQSTTTQSTAQPVAAGDSAPRLDQ